MAARRYLGPITIGAIDLLAFSTLLTPNTPSTDAPSPAIVVLAIAALNIVVLVHGSVRPVKRLAALVAISSLSSVLGTYRPVLFVCVALGTVGRRMSLRTGIACLGMACIAVVSWVIDERQSTSPGQPTDQAVTLVFLGLIYMAFAAFCWAIGRSRFVAERLEFLTLERTRRHAEATAAAAERQRVARELHDIVSNAIAVMTVSASAAGRLHPGRPDDVTRMLEQIERTGRDASDELHRLLGALRAHAASDATSAPPDVETIIARMRSAGLDIEVQTIGCPRPLAASVGATVGRLVQETLTNALKHADRSRPVLLRQEWGDTSLRIVVRNTVAMQRAGRRRGTSGYGLVGLRERVAIVGGTLRSAQLDDEFEVVADLPVGASRPTAMTAP